MCMKLQIEHVSIRGPHLYYDRQTDQISNATDQNPIYIQCSTVKLANLVGY